MRLNVIEMGEGSPVLLLHGLFGAARNWGGIQKRLAQRHRVLAPDLRNHGESDHAAAMDYPSMAEDVAEVIARRGLAPAAVLGHSMGGKVAMALALRHPEMVGRLVVAEADGHAGRHPRTDHLHREGKEQQPEEGRVEGGDGQGGHARNGSVRARKALGLSACTQCPARSTTAKRAAGKSWRNRA